MVVDDTLMSVLEDRLETLRTARRAGTITPKAEAEVAAISRTMSALTARGFIRLCPDEEMFRRHGVYGVDFPRGVFPTLERPVLEDVAVDLREQLKAGHDVVVDHGFWTPEDRTKWRAIATDAGATPVVVYLEASHDELWARISKRNEFHANDPNSIYFAESDLQRYRTRFVPPQADEPHLLYDGGLAAVIAALEDSHP